MKCKAILFDLDGTLLDTIDDLADSMNAVLEAHSLRTYATEQYKIFIGDGLPTLITRVAPEAIEDKKLAASIHKGMLEEYDRRWDNKTKLYDGISEMLDGLVERGVTMTVFSNKPHEFTGKCVSKFLSGWEFKIVLGIGDETPAKPDPTGALRLTEKLGIAADEFFYLGDTNTDMKTANAAGMYAVGAEWGFRSESELYEHNAKIVIKHPVELLDLL